MPPSAPMVMAKSKASDAIERLVAARSDLTRSLLQMSLRLSSVLSSEQWTELKKRRPPQAVGDMMMLEMQRRRGMEGPRKDGRRPGPPPGQQPPQRSKQ